MNEHDYAEYLASCEEDRIARIEEEYGENPTCGWCGETAVDPVLHEEGTMGEELMCRECSERVDSIPYEDDSENFGCDYGVGLSDSYLEGPGYPD